MILFTRFISNDSVLYQPRSLDPLFLLPLDLVLVSTIAAVLYSQSLLDPVNACMFM
jgi:hypothetical protein